MYTRLLQRKKNAYVGDKARARLSCCAHGAATSRNDFVLSGQLLPDLKLDRGSVWQMNRVAHECCPNCHLAGWVKLTSHIAKYQTRLANTLSITQEALVSQQRRTNKHIQGIMHTIRLAHRVAKQNQLDPRNSCCCCWLLTPQAPDFNGWLGGCRCTSDIRDTQRTSSPCSVLCSRAQTT